MARPILVCSDRDGTITKDDDFYLGKDAHWEEQIEFMPGVIEGIKTLRTMPQLYFFIVTNQSGVAISSKGFEQLDEKRMHEVNRHVIERLREQRAFVNGYFACPFVDSKYLANAQKKGRVIDPRYVNDTCRDIKPNIGMLEKAANSMGLSLDECDLWVIGDRVSDMELAKNGKGRGILVASSKTDQLGDIERVKRVTQTYNGIFIAPDYNAAAKIIIRSAIN